MTKEEAKRYEKDFKRIMSLTPVKSQDSCLEEMVIKNRGGKVLGPALVQEVEGTKSRRKATLSFGFNLEGKLMAVEVYIPSLKETFTFMENATDEFED